MKKSDDAYKSIGEVAKILNLSSSSIWNFFSKPRILTGRRRYYDNSTIEALKKIKFLLKNQGMTIKGVKKVLSESTSFNLDDLSNKSINMNNNLVLKKKISKISKLIKDIKGLK